MKTLLWLEDENSHYDSFGIDITESYSITRAHDYHEAVSYFKNNKYDGIIVDLIVPSGEATPSPDQVDDLYKHTFGFLFVDLIRNQLHDETPIIVLSVINLNAHLDALLKLRVNDILYKYASTKRDILESVKSHIG